MNLSVVIPVYNEENTVLIILEKILKLKEVFEVVVVDDGSTDRTLPKLQSFYKKLSAAKRKKIRIYSKKNGGKGSAVRYGLQKVTGTHTLIQDADLEYDPEDIPSLIEPIQKGRVEVVYGSRFLGPHSNLLFWHRLGNSFLNLLVNVLYNTTLSDMETCYKVLPTKIFRQLGLQANRFDLEPEITCKVLRLGINIYEVPISYVGRDFDSGKKITWRDGFGAVWMVIKSRI